MDDGTWTYKCRKCDSAFDLLLNKGDDAIDLARDARCPGCGTVPGDASPAEAMRGHRWHKIIGFILPRITRLPRP
jgi:DNA-directed RNA polymerase subunit RPC12/RpoP